MKRLYIELSHGRVHPDEKLPDWGFDGPLIGPIAWFHAVYGDHQRYAFEDNSFATANALAFGLSRDDADEMEIDYHGGLVKFEGFYFGDMSILNFSDVVAKQRIRKWFQETKLQQLSRQAQWLKAERERAS